MAKKKYTWPELAELVKHTERDTTGMLYDKDFVAIRNICYHTMHLISMHRRHTVVNEFSSRHPWVYNLLKDMVGKIVLVTDAALRKEVGASEYDGSLTPFYCQSIGLDPVFYDRVKLFGHFVCSPAKSRTSFYETDPYEIDVSQLVHKSITIKIDKTHAKLAQDVRKLYPPSGFCIASEWSD